MINPELSVRNLHKQALLLHSQALYNHPKKKKRTNQPYAKHKCNIKYIGTHTNPIREALFSVHDTEQRITPNKTVANSKE